ncbi:hypothetical protein ACIP98_41455 [Streptomyces sp. NPDC088354]|uniref:hypothetical protein n=1 Tax=Streptomyces sp. NPDC088354 TaxID=3365856 RepID=UPI0037F61FDD
MFAVFAIGFFACPLDTVVFGHIGDRFGRRPALLVSVVVVGAATALIGCLLTHDPRRTWRGFFSCCSDWFRALR